MFTGLVETTGKLRARTRRGPGYRLAIQTDLGGLELGESIAVSGACLTVVAASHGGFEADISLETAQKTTLGQLAVGGTVNLERALRLGDRMGGHLVSGHVDGIAVVEQLAPAGDALRISLRIPENLAPYLAKKGSVALEGVSLTVNAVSGAKLEVMLVPHTREVTSLQEIAVGRELNLEVDMLARYVVRYLAAAGIVADNGKSGAFLGEASATDQRDEQSLAKALKRAGIV